ncbi:MAG: hypothetical protein KC731_13580 [Myxococcales bacterium]|nr:hypothetical protein [Myxococcales bacterium]
MFHRLCLLLLLLSTWLVGPRSGSVPSDPQAEVALHDHSARHVNERVATLAATDLFADLEEEDQGEPDRGAPPAPRVVGALRQRALCSVCEPLPPLPPAGVLDDDHDRRAAIRRWRTAAHLARVGDDASAS